MPQRNQSFTSKVGAQRFSIALACILTLSGCRSFAGSFLAPKPELPDRILYVVATGIEQNGRFYNELVLVDPEQWTVLSRTSLPADSAFTQIARDSINRIWVPFHGAPGVASNIVGIFHPDGALFRELQTCYRPHSVFFSQNYAYVACTYTGFSGRFVKVDMDTFEITETIEFGNENKKFHLIASASDSHVKLLWGAAGDSHQMYEFLEDTEYITSTVVNGPMWTQDILPTGKDRFIVLNVGSGRTPNNTVRDILFVNTQEGDVATETNSLPARGPLWGAIVDDNLYAYHNGGYGSTRKTDERAITRFDIQTGETELWPLPDNWNARDLEIIDGRIMLTLRSNDPKAGGIYEFDPETGSLEQVMQLPGATLMLPPDD